MSELRFLVTVLVALSVGWLIGTYLVGRERQCVTFDSGSVGLVVYCYRGSHIGTGL